MIGSARLLPILRCGGSSCLAALSWLRDKVPLQCGPPPPLLDPGKTIRVATNEACAARTSEYTQSNQSYAVELKKLRSHPIRNDHCSRTATESSCVVKYLVDYKVLPVGSAGRTQWRPQPQRSNGGQLEGVPFAPPSHGAWQYQPNRKAGFLSLSNLPSPSAFPWKDIRQSFARLPYGTPFHFLNLFRNTLWEEN